jgi:DNA-binding transcriptional ArsR family regulator
MPVYADDIEATLRALANDRRLLILQWLKHPKAHFRAQADGDLVADGVCGVLIAEKLGVSQPTVSEHLKILAQAGLLSSKRVKQWTFYKRNEAQIAKIKRAIAAKI